jgi:hypothetical protein
MTDDEARSLKPGDKVIVTRDVDIPWMSPRGKSDLEKGDILTVDGDIFFSISTYIRYITEPYTSQGVDYNIAVIPPEWVERYDDTEEKALVCKCDVWITGCKCGVFKQEMANRVKS